MDRYPAYGELLARMHRKCRDCSGTKTQAKKCKMTSCPLWPVPGLHVQRETTGERKRNGRQVRMTIRGDLTVEIK